MQSSGRHTDICAHSQKIGHSLTRVRTARYYAAGFGDITPKTASGKWFTIFYIVSGSFLSPTPWHGLLSA